MDDGFRVPHDDRDAWAAIRGYVYQVDLTILRWLELRPHEQLELECGEDIDIVGPTLAGGQGLTRVLEQVKCVNGTLTLRSPRALAVVISFTEHVAANPAVSLRFRFTTTAIPAAERPASPLAFTPGILLWERIRTGSVDAQQRQSAIASIAAFFRGLPKPDSIRANSWKTLCDLAADLDRFGNIITSFEWGTGTGTAASIEGQVQEALVSRGHAQDSASAKIRHDQLFVFVMRLLTRRRGKAPKRLGAADLKNCIESLAVNEAERRTLEELRDVRKQMAEGFLGIHCSLAEIKGDTEEIKAILVGRGEASNSFALKRVINLPSIKVSFEAASAGLLSCPQETEGLWIPRPELDQLESLILDKKCSSTVLLGVPGCGKSALLARLGTRLRASGTTLLALKTERLPRSIESLAELDRHLEIGSPLVGAIKEIAEQERVVLLVDQLDALGSLMDQQTNRLSIVLQLLYRLKGLENVHILVSCREFDYRYDARFSVLQADELHLLEPPWENIQPLLESAGLSAATWPADMRDALRNPQHLKIFLENFASDLSAPLFTSYQAMLEAMFTKRVVDPYGSLTVEACEELAGEMSDAEELWISRTAFDVAHPGQVDRLIAAGILQPSGRTIGFRHQTLFDYARTRAFCSGSQSLAKHVLDRQDALFVRSTLWASLHALRSTAPNRYRQELGTLWEQSNLRRHVRLLLISFLGQISDPDPDEARWLLPTIDDPLLGGKTLAAVVGSPGWFKRLQSRLPSLMAESDSVRAWQVTFVLQAALRFDRQTVFRLMDRYWIDPSCHEYVLHTVRDLQDWDEQAVAVVEGILSRMSVRTYYVVHVAELASRSAPALAPRIVSAALWCALRRAQEQVVQEPPPLPLDVTPLDLAVHCLTSRRYAAEPIRKLVDSPEWHGIEKIVLADPAAFLQHVWPWFLKVAELLEERANPRVVEYRQPTEIELGGEFTGMNKHILLALKSAIETYAGRDSDGFLRFADRHFSSGLIVVHRLLAYGFCRIASVYPKTVLTYLTGDARRLNLGGYKDRHGETRMLISAVAPSLSVEDLGRLETFITNWNCYLDSPGDEPQTRWERRKWNREHRLRLLRSFPADHITPNTKRLRDQEEVALPHTRDYSHRIENGSIGSSVSVEQMARASDRDIVNLFRERPDRTGASHPLDPYRGGYYQASLAFGEFAKTQAQRAMRIVDQFEAGTQEQPAACAINAISETEYPDAATVVAQIHRLSDRGFSSRDFRTTVSWALQRLAGKCGGLDDRTCALLQGWLEPAKDGGEQQGARTGNNSEHPSSLLWSGGGLRVLPSGNYPILTALERGYLLRTKPDIAAWLTVLERHLDLAEDVAVWQAVVYYLRFLGGYADVKRSVEFLSRLFELYPDALACFEGALFLALSHRWLPQSFTHKCFRLVQQSGWPLKGQALGELTMLRLATVPTDDFCREIVEGGLAGGSTEFDWTDSLRLGIGFAATHLWSEPECRVTAHAVLMRTIGWTGDRLSAAIMDVFRVAHHMPPDQCTAELLDGLVQNPDLIRLGGPSFLTDRLIELLADGFDPERVAGVARTILTVCGNAVGDIRTAWAGNAGDLIKIALTLQRIKHCRSVGLELFESLMDLGAYEADRVLREIDRRPY